MSHVMRKPVYAICIQQRQDQTARMRSLISAFVLRYLDSIIPLLAKSKISRLQLASEAEQSGLSLIWSDHIHGHQCWWSASDLDLCFGRRNTTLRRATFFYMHQSIYHALIGEKQDQKTKANWQIFWRCCHIVYFSYIIEPRHEKTCLRGLRPG